MIINTKRNNLKCELMKTKILLIFTAIAMLFLVSCSKNDDTDDPAIDLANNDAITEAVVEDLFNSVDDAEIRLEDYLKGEGKSEEIPTCPSVTFDRPPDSDWPKTVTIDYGTGCTGFYDNTRSGKITVIISGPRLEEGSVKTITLDNYTFNGITVEGTKVITNLGYNNNQHMEFSVTLTGGKVTLPDGRTIERSFERTREWFAGMDTKTIWDDEFLVTGVTTGKDRFGSLYTNTIMTAIHWTRACRFAVSGIMKLEVDGLDPVELNYGEGECDALAVVTIGDKSKEITLRHR